MAAAFAAAAVNKQKETKNMKQKIYHSLQMDLLYVEEEDIITASAGALDSNKDDDVIHGDIFG